MAKINLSIYLIKQEFIEVEEILKEEFLNEENILLNHCEGKVAYFKPSFINEPDWLMNFFKISDSRLKTSNARVVYINKVEVKNNEFRYFAIIFGYGKNMLNDDVIEENFGLKIVLNTVEKNKLRRISKVDIGKNYKQSQEQMPKESNILEFGFDFNRDLVKYVTAKSEDEEFGKAIITGGDLFSLTIDKNIENIDNFLIYCYSKYELTTYKDHFEWIDNIKEVRDFRTIEILENEVVRQLNEGDFTNIWMGIPEFIDWGRVKGFKFTGQRDRTIIYDDIKIEDFINTYIGEIENYSKIKNKSVYCIDNNNEKLTNNQWPAHKCLIGNIEINGKTYSINNGKWYNIDNDFVEMTNNNYNSIELANIDVIEYTEDTKDETEYNNRLADTNEDYHCLHTITVPFGGGAGNNIEPCDIFFNNNFIHIKKGGASAYLSHLFNQAYVSASAFKDTEFRNKYNEKLREKNLDEIIIENYDAKDYTVVIAIINKNSSDERPHIPFFSKVSIDNIRRSIENMDYKVKIKSIKK